MMHSTLYNDNHVLSHFRPQSPTSRQESEMADRSIRDLKAGESMEDPVQRLRLLCASRGATGILLLGRLFRKMDKHGHRKLGKEKFLRGLHLIGLDITDEEAGQMFKKFDTDCSGKIDMDEFLFQIRPEMSNSRIQIIDAAFKKLDKTGEGVISFDDLKHVYNVDSQPRYINGEDSKESLITTFLGHFEKDTTIDGKVTKEEFMNYYAGISASIDNDCYFDLMMRQAYKL